MSFNGDKKVDSVNYIYHPQQTICSEDCPNGLGAVCGKHSTGETGLRRNHHCILILERTAAFFAVNIYAAALSETAVHRRVDNTATLASINRQNAPNETVDFLLKEFWEVYAEKQI